MHMQIACGHSKDIALMAILWIKGCRHVHG